MDRKFILCAKMFLLMLGRDPIEGLFFTKDLKIQFGPPADLAAAHKWWCLSERHHRSFRSKAIECYREKSERDTLVHAISRRVIYGKTSYDFVFESIDPRLVI